METQFYDVIPMVENLFACWVQSDTGSQKTVIGGGRWEGQAKSLAVGWTNMLGCVW